MLRMPPVTGVMLTHTSLRIYPSEILMAAGAALSCEHKPFFAPVIPL